MASNWARSRGLNADCETVKTAELHLLKTQHSSEARCQLPDSG
jgi:hypothetical protein